MGKMVFINGEGINFKNSETGKLSEALKSKLYDANPAEKRMLVKSLIEEAPSNEIADEIISVAYEFKTIEEKITFLHDMFAIEEVGHKHKDEVTYYTMLNVIHKIKQFREGK